MCLGWVPLLGIRAATLTLILFAQGGPPVDTTWEPSPGGPAHDQVVRLARRITKASVLGDDIQPLMSVLPLSDRDARADKARQLWMDRQRRLRERLGPVHDFEVFEVLRDERDRYKVHVRCYASPPGPSPKRPFKGLTFIFASGRSAWRLHWLAFWEPGHPSWNVLEDE